MKANVPAGVAVPPLNTELLSACPYTIALAVGHAVTLDAALVTVTLTVPFVAL
jgi:hypothetical protein